MRSSRGQSDWRAAADPDDLREYDRFGPWIDQVREPVDMPRRFRPWWPELSGARYLIKVPREYDRSQVRPGMDLYRAVIAVFPTGITVLRADGPAVSRVDVPLGQVVATVRHANLLLGRWTLLLADGRSVEVEFNTVSERLIAEVDAYVLGHPARDERRSALLPAITVEDHYFRAVIAELNAATDEQMQPVHVEEPGRPCTSERGWRRRSTGLLLLASADDVVIVNRDIPSRSRFSGANYATNIVTVPVRGVSSYAVLQPEPTTPPRFSTLLLTCGEQVVAQPCLERPDAVVAVLAAAGVPADDRSGAVVGLR